MGSMVRFCIEHFSHVFPILACGAFGIVVMVERITALCFSYPITHFEAFFERLRLLVMKDQVSEAIALCEQHRGKPAVNIVREGLMRAHQPESLIESGLQIVATDVTEKITSRTAFLATVANVATLFGLLGTIIGLVQSFEAVGSANAQARSALLAAGISTAMNATMLGLGVAIPCMIVYAFLMSRTNKLIAEVEQAGVRTLDILRQRYYSSVPAPLNHENATFPTPVLRKKA